MVQVSYILFYNKVIITHTNDCHGYFITLNELLASSWIYESLKELSAFAKKKVTYVMKGTLNFKWHVNDTFRF